MTTMADLTTKSGKFIIADITDPSFFPGKSPPAMYQDPTHEGSWFFWPCEFLAGDFGGIAVARLSGYPMCYSPGFATSEAALEAAEKWEVETPKRMAEDRQAEARMAALFGDSGVVTFNLNKVGGQ